MDFSRLPKNARDFLQTFFINMEINREFYRLGPEEKFDFRMVDNYHRKSDSPRESLIHQIDTTRDYVNGLKSGELKFGINYADLHPHFRLSKDKLLKLLTKSETELIEALSDKSISEKKVKVPWSTKSVPALSAIWGLNNHEILHTGWNLAIMDHLNIHRYPSIAKVWG